MAPTAPVTVATILSLYKFSEKYTICFFFCYLKLSAFLCIIIIVLLCISQSIFRPWKIIFLLVFLFNSDFILFFYFWHMQNFRIVLVFYSVKNLSLLDCSLHFTPFQLLCFVFCQFSRLSPISLSRNSLSISLPSTSLSHDFLSPLFLRVSPLCCCVRDGNV